MRVEEIHAMQHERSRVNHDTYKHIFQECCERIRRRAGMPGGLRSIEFRVPPMVWGRPPFKHHHAVRYVCEKLRMRKFDVEAPPGMATLVVSWPPPPPPPTPKKQPAKKDAKKAAAAKPLSVRLEALRKKFT